MLYKFFLTQWMYPVRNDWVHQVREDLADFNLEVDLDQLTKMSKNRRWLKSERIFPWIFNHNKRETLKNGPTSLS